mgnify:CR=1 FL=1
MKSFKVACLCLTAFFITSCLKKVVPPPKAPVIKNQTQIRTTRHFSDIEFDGDLDVVIKRSRKGSSLSLKGDSRDLAFITSTVKDGKVSVDIPDHYLKHGPVSATVYVNKINRFSFNGNGNISGKQLKSSDMSLLLYVNGKVDLSGDLELSELKVTGKNTVMLKGVHSSSLDITMNASSDINMQGVVKLEHLKFGGSGKLALHWIDSPDLTVEGHGDVKVYLGGIARFLHATTYDKSELDARYLRSMKVYVKAFDYSLIRVISSKELNAFAVGNGHINYYQSPRLRAEHMVQNGAILNFVQYR